MARDPIGVSDFNIEAVFLVLTRLERGQETLVQDINRIFELHRMCLTAQAEKAVGEGQQCERLEGHEQRIKGLEAENTNSRNHRKQLTTGLTLTATAALVSLVVSLILKRW